MKFTLVEGMELEEEVLNEKTSIYYELANYLMSDISNNTSHPGGFISHLKEWQRRELIDELTIYVRNKYELQDPKEITDKVHEIMNTWVVHHINGIHPDKYKTVNNNSNNLVLLDGTKLHEEVTQRYKEEIVKCVQNLPVQVNDDVDKLLLRLLVVCKETQVDVNDILSIDMSGFEEALYSVANKLTQFFITNYPRTRNDVIYLSDLNLSW